MKKKIVLPNWKKRSSPACFIRVWDARVAKEVTGHFPAPILLSGHKHSRPSVYPYIVFPYFSIFKKTCNGAITALMAAPYLITMICSLAPIRMKVAAHKGASAVPIRIKPSPVFRSGLRDDMSN